LTGIAESGADVTYTCTARCVDVTEEEMGITNAPGMDNRAYSFVTVTWEKLTEWA
jgi:hypothetical protein